MHRVNIEVRPNPTPFTARPAAGYLAHALAARITGPAEIKVTPTEAGGFLIDAAFSAINNVEHHRCAANDVLSAVSALDLYAVRVIATRTATWAAAGLITGMIGGLGASATQKAELAPWIAAAATIVGTIVGNAMEREIRVFEWRRDAAGRWCDVQQPPWQSGWGWQPS